ncbi:MAG: serine/threonine-protein kinase [Myxococcota bacterium]
MPASSVRLSPSVDPTPPRPPAVAPLELARLRGAVRAGLFQVPASSPRVGRYELLRCIGQGGMGIVYAARDVELGREVAIKLLRPELSAADDGRLTSEARALARLSHPNVVAVFDVGTYEGQRFIAMEYVVGQDLRRWLDAPRSLRELLRVFVEAGRGLHAAHEVGLVHRDFKPDNVLVGDDGRSRVLDFGLARPPDDAAGGVAHPPALPPGVDPLATVLTVAGQVLGTPAYMAPEQHLGEPADARSDQFSFAVALYHAVYGVRPFSGQDLQALALSIVRGRVRPASPRYPVPAWLDALLERALAVDPAGRYPSMRHLLTVVERHLEAGTAELDVRPNRAMVDELAEVGGGGSMDGSWEPSGLVGLGVAPTLHAASRSAVSGVPAVPAPAAGGRVAVLAQPPNEDLDGHPTSLSTRRTLVALSEDTQQLLVRELIRLEGRRGKVERLGSCLTWTSRELEVHLDVSAQGTELLVWRKLQHRRRRATFGWMAFGMWLSSIFIAAIEGSGLVSSIETFELVPLFVIGTLFGGGVAGYRKAQRRLARSLPAERARLEFIADRLVALGQANPSPALPSAY